MFHRRKQPVAPKGPTLKLDSPDPIPIMEASPPRTPWISEAITRLGGPIAQWMNAQDQAYARVSLKFVGILAFLSIFVVVSGATTVAFIPVLAITLAASLLSAFVVSIIYLGYTGFTAEEGWVRRLLAPLADLLPPSVGVSEVVKKNGSAKVATVTEIDPDDERLEGVSNDKVSEQQNSEAVS
ncbi:Hypothetical protein PAS_chr1-3_0245 [Komagataella phaffii GS115]|uniref:Uncharacterized protein n=1 Tax=Komagataella phaffii (strain GS115 / ATCC 20864) TaxID=644223 RepID=C4QVN6_KOMPG|nr:Hypothetical protein PAS_chr1-3_0245 [Komagataella phaffii GS115]CAY67309.1 Hypothetical protein PAS_chr1-3_0245 [Komagataella phaffii GS115]